MSALYISGFEAGVVDAPSSNGASFNGTTVRTGAYSLALTGPGIIYYTCWSDAVNSDGYVITRFSFYVPTSFPVSDSFYWSITDDGQTSFAYDASQGQFGFCDNTDTFIAYVNGITPAVNTWYTVCLMAYQVGGTSYIKYKVKKDGDPWTTGTVSMGSGTVTESFAGALGISQAGGFLIDDVHIETLADDSSFTRWNAFGDGRIYPTRPSSRDGQTHNMDAYPSKYFHYGTGASDFTSSIENVSYTSVDDLVLDSGADSDWVVESYYTPISLLLDPDTSITSGQWTSSGTFPTNLAGKARDPTAPSLTGYISSSNNAQTAEMGCNSATKAGTIQQVILHWYGMRGHATRQSITASIWSGGSQLASGVDNASTSAHWEHGVVYNGDLTQTQLDALQIRFVHAETQSTTSVSYVYAAYIEIVYLPQAPSSGYFAEWDLTNPPLQSMNAVAAKVSARLRQFISGDAKVTLVNASRSALATVTSTTVNSIHLKSGASAAVNMVYSDVVGSLVRFGQNTINSEIDVYVILVEWEFEATTPAGSTPISGTDANGTTTETVSIVVQTTATDQNAATSEIIAAFTRLIADANGTTTEDASVTQPPVPISGTDQNGTTTESAVPRYLAAATDQNGVVTEAIVGPTGQISATDANGATTETTADKIVSSDSGTSTEVISSRVIGTTESGSGSDSSVPTLASTITDVDAGGTIAAGEDATKFIASQSVSDSDSNGTTTEATVVVGKPTVTDQSGTTTEATAEISQVPAADQNATTTETASAGVPIAGSDANGTTTESASEVSAIPVSDANGATTESQTYKYPLTTPDSNGVTTESVAVVYTIPATDANGVVTESIGLVITVTDNNSVTTETGSPVGKPIATDQNSTTNEVASTGSMKSGSDANGTTTESAAPRFQPVQTDQSGTITETAAPAYAQATADQNSTTTESAAITAVQTSSTDSNSTTTETPVLAGKPTATDSNSATTESQAEINKTTTTDQSGVATEDASTSSITSKSSSDSSGTATESASPGFLASGQDSGTLSTESASARPTIASTDSGTSTEIATNTRGIATTSDTGSGSDLAAPVYRPNQTDTGYGTDGQSVIYALAGNDTASATEDVALVVVILETDVGTGLDVGETNYQYFQLRGTMAGLLSAEPRPGKLLSAEPEPGEVLISRIPDAILKEVK